MSNFSLPLSECCAMIRKSRENKILFDLLFNILTRWYIHSDRNVNSLMTEQLEIFSTANVLCYLALRRTDYCNDIITAYEYYLLVK